MLYHFLGKAVEIRITRTVGDEISGEIQKIKGGMQVMGNGRCQDWWLLIRFRLEHTVGAWVEFFRCV